MEAPRPTPQNRPRWPAAVAVTVACFAYAAVRYHVFGGVSWQHAPLWTANKALAWAAVLLLLWSAVEGRRAPRQPRNNGLLRAGLTLAFGHVGASIVLLDPSDFPALYDGGRLTLWAGGSMLLGLGATALIRLRRPRPLAAAGLTVAAHAALIGAGGWIQPAAWPGGLVPISLLGALSGLALALAVRRD